MQLLQKNWLDSRLFDRYILHYATPKQLIQPAIKEWIVQGLIQAMPTLKIEQYFQAKQNWFEECDYLIVAVEAISNDLIAILASSWVEMDSLPFLHVKIQMIADRYQKTHLLKRMWGFHLYKVSQEHFGFPSIVALKTCHPAVFSAMRVFSRFDGVQMYPRIDGEIPKLEMNEIACLIAKSICPGLEFCLHTGVIKNASVPIDFYPSLPTTKKPDIGYYFQNNLTPVDRLLCILHISTDLAKHRILQSLDKKL
ncbi:MAG: hypothetical protein V7K89_20280 [Nostoc sp.]|uniref:hypothetical protein n=1 Tax=Nostoc sp. TaxID=1180 RepID=UPI002FF6D05C